MRNSISISLPDAIFRQLKSESKEESSNSSEIVRKALREYFFREKFDRLRKKAKIEAVKRGIRLTEEEIFEQVS
ncbi:MAG: ribbon-helix-helix protein, CopG family [Candidatus Firestonebacteria bacterium]